MFGREEESNLKSCNPCRIAINPEHMNISVNFVVLGEKLSVAYCLQFCLFRKPNPDYSSRSRYITSKVAV
jgi:hypothetical protein